MSTLAHARLAEERKNFRKSRPFGFVAKPLTREDGSVDLMVRLGGFRMGVLCMLCCAWAARLQHVRACQRSQATVSTACACHIACWRCTIAALRLTVCAHMHAGRRSGTASCLERRRRSVRGELGELLLLCCRAGLSVVQSIGCREGTHTVRKVTPHHGHWVREGRDSLLR